MHARTALLLVAYDNSTLGSYGMPDPPVWVLPEFADLAALSRAQIEAIKSVVARDEARTAAYMASSQEAHATTARLVKAAGSAIDRSEIDRMVGLVQKAYKDAPNLRSATPRPWSWCTTSY